MFEWTSSFEIGIPLIDDQHKVLFDIGKELENIAERSDKVDSNDIADLLKKMEDYSIYHFSHEEKLMQAAKYDGLENHKKEHKSFIDYLATVDKNIAKNQGAEKVNELILFLAKWIFKHIKESDFKYGELLKWELKL